MEKHNFRAAKNNNILHYTADEIINMIAETLAETEGGFIEEIANRVLGGNIKYNGDSIFTMKIID